LKWSETQKGLLIDPTDREINAFHDPYAHEVRLSPKLIEWLRREIKEPDV
jgi:hypothetical protein